MVNYRNNAAVQIFADTEAALSRMRQTAGMAGCRIVTAELVGGSGGEIGPVPGASLLIELDDGAADGAAIALLDLARTEAGRGVRRSIVAVRMALLDLAVARASHADIELLCEADEDERLAAVRRATSASESRLHDGRRERDFGILLPAADKATTPRNRQTAHADAAFIRTLLRTRRLRTHFFRSDLFADPAWDMLLDLMAARLEGKPVAVSSLCIAAAVPPTTALRWIGVLTESGLVVRVADRNDGRRVYIELAEPTARALAAWLDEARRMLGKLC